MSKSEWVQAVIAASDEAFEAYKVQVQAFAKVSETDFFEGFAAAMRLMRAERVLH